MDVRGLQGKPLVPRYDAGRSVAREAKLGQPSLFSIKGADSALARLASLTTDIILITIDLNTRPRIGLPS